ncbi:sarcoplasmic calcium-binding proteins I, III, and IV-like isoform X2 [Lineus longissimus]|uniref:sarcoplasmic calcium-binding proteins I, III, and IV-like isoform X2 n=1 Tax=Lineus longissimus TaxID=88925 RepID=UPI002B4DAE8B
MNTQMAATAKTTLSPFQEEKFIFFFEHFDINKDGFIDDDDINALLKKIMEYTQWAETSSLAGFCKEFHGTFLKTMIEKKGSLLKPDGETLEEEIARIAKLSNKISQEEWLAMWEHMIRGCMGMQDFPVWLQLLPKILFDIVDFKSDAKIDVEELEEFYSGFMGIKDRDTKELATYAHGQMTDRDTYVLDIATYNQVFSNFILAKHSCYGPGRFIFGTFDSASEHTSIRIIPTREDDDPDTGRRDSGSNRRFSKTAHPVVYKRYWKN